ncbi:MAG: DUF1499 domain-containing protein [Longimicrobiales bacterium]
MKGSQTLSTSPEHSDTRLQGRTYAIPFEDVWQGALRIIREKSKRWSLDTADDQEGVINADVRGLYKKLNGTVVVRVALDAEGQTRVDAHARTPAAFTDFGVNARRLDRFFRGLDRESVKEWERRMSGGR